MLNDDFLGVGTMFSMAVEATLLKNGIRLLRQVLLRINTLIVAEN